MKKNILISSIFGVSALVAFAQDATPTYDLYYDKVISTTTPVTDYLSTFTDEKGVVHEGITYKYKDSNGVEQTYTGEIGANTNITLNITESEDFDTSQNYNSSILFQYGTSSTSLPLTVGDLKYYINTASPSSFRLLGQYAKPLNAKSIEVELDSKAPNTLNYTGITFNTGTSYGINVENDFIVRSVGTKYWNVGVTFGYCGSVSVGGDFIVSNDKGKVELTAGSIGWEWAGFTVGGVLKLESAAGNYAWWKFASGNWNNTKRTLGGLDVAHDGVIGIDTVRANDTQTSIVSNLTFTNSSKHEYVGSLAEVKVDIPHLLNVTMNATDATNGRQILRFEEYVYRSGLNANFVDASEVLNNIVVNSGRLDLGMHTNGMFARNLTLNGENAVFSSTALMTNEEIGYTNFASANLTKGTLVFDYSIDANDTININNNGVEGATGALTVANASDITIILQEIDGSDIKTWLQDEGIDSFSFDILSFESTNLTEESIADINVVSSNGMDAVLSAIKTDGVITGIQATIAVPEPATVAGIFGLFALAFVAYRRRK